MRIGIMLSRFAVGDHGPIDFKRWREGRALNGTELATIHVAQGLGELGHDVDLFCADAVASELCGSFHVYALQHAFTGDYDALIAVSDPTLLQGHVSPLRVNWSHAATFHGDPTKVDAHVFVSATQRAHVLGGAPALPAERAVWIPNAYDAMVYNTEAVRRRPYSMAWLSSPDRGLHRLLEMWPAIRARVPAATLRIFYRFDPWVSAHRQRDNLHGERARYIDAALAAFGRNGENGITVMGPVTHVDFVRELLGTWVVPYTYDPPGPMAEAFCIALLDACAAGCTPLCSDQDALGANFGDVAEVIPGRPGDSQGQWIDAIVIAATHENQGRRRARQRWARQFDRYRVAALWDSFLCANVHDGDRAAKLDTSMMPATMKEFAPCT